MFVLKPEQLTVLGERSFAQRFREVLVEAYPARAGRIPPSELEAQILKQARNAEEYGLLSEQPVATFVMTAWLLGPDFDEKIPAVQEQLSSNRLTENEKAEWLERFSVLLLQTLEKR